MTKCGSYKQVAQATQTGTKLPAGTRVFVLSGTSGQGKTTTLNKLAAYMASKSGWMVLKSIVGRKDSKYVIENKSSGIIAGISTAGDNTNEIIKGFSLFRTNGCNVCFIASKTSGISIHQIEKECYADSIIPQYQFLHGEYSPNWRDQNKVQADVVAQLFKMI